MKTSFTADYADNSDKKFSIRPIRVIRGKTFLPLFLLASLLVVGCSHNQSPLTIAPHSVVSTGASFEGNDRNSGLISSDATGFLVTQHFIERHQVNTTDSGVRAEGHNYRLTAQVMARCIEFDRLRKNAQK